MPLNTPDKRQYWIARTEASTYRRVRKELAQGPLTYYWTLGEKSKRGDLVVLYGFKPMQEFGAIGVALREPQKSRKDGRYWTEILFSRLVEPMPISDLEALRSEPLQNLARLAKGQGAHARIKDAPAAERLFRRLLSGSKRTGASVAKWKAGEIPHPGGRDLSKQRYRSKVAQFKGTDMELAYQARIEGQLIRTLRARRLTDQDEVHLPESNHLGRHIGYPDRVLVDRRHRNTLLLIEVKRWAVPGETTAGVIQLLRYEKALRKRAKGWKIRKVLIAREIDPKVVKLAKSKGIETWTFRRLRFRSI